MMFITESVHEKVVIAPSCSQDTCGIIGYVGREEAIGYLIDGLTILQNRGYGNFLNSF
jgi:hypothetical protein